MPIVLLIIIILLAVFVPLGLVFGVLRRVAARQEQAARQRFPDAKLIVSSANYFGQQSRGRWQLGGNGTLVLTEHELYFAMWLLRREIHIPLRSIQAIETPNSFLGRMSFTPLLKVVFQDAAGQTDAVAWQVADLAGVKRALEEALAH